ncbi:MAG: TolC family protein [Deltaproteobacteria bacterium]|nr:TolC family protein [Deltaproteobacteria bacterium]
MTVNRLKLGLLGWLALAFGLVFPGQVRALENYPAALSLAEALQITKEQNPGIKAARAACDISRQHIVQTRAGLLPQLNLNEYFQRSNNPPLVFSNKLSQGRFGSDDFAIDRLNHPEALNNFSTSLNLSWPLYDRGQSWHGLKQAKLGYQAAEQTLAQNEEQALAQTTRAYFGVLLAGKGVNVVQAALTTARANLKLVASRYRNGMVVKSDALQAQVHVADLEQQHLTAASNLQAAQAALHNALGITNTQPFTLTDELLPGDQIAGTIDDWLARAQAQRPDLKGLRLRETIAAEEIAKARAAYLPAVNLVGSYQIDSEDFSESADSCTVGAVVSLNLFSGLATSARAKEAAAALRQIAALRLQAENQTALEIRQAYLAAASAWQRIEVARQALKQSAEALRIVSKRYAGGLLTIVELLGAENARQQTLMMHFQAIHDYLVAGNALKLAAGDLTTSP